MKFYKTETYDLKWDGSSNKYNLKKSGTVIINPNYIIKIKEIKCDHPVQEDIKNHYREIVFFHINNIIVKKEFIQNLDLENI